jgi:hypothetical protein
MEKVITAEQIEAWKKEHGQVFKYVADDKVAYLRAVDRDTYALAAAKVSSAGPGKFNDIIIERIWLAGDEELRKQNGYYFGLIEFIEELMAKKKGTLTEL